MDKNKTGKAATKTDRGVFSAKDFIQRIEKSGLFMNKKLLCVILITGILLMIIPDAGKKRNKAEGIDEQRLCEILGDIKGAGDVDAFVTYYPGTDDESGLVMGAVITAEGAEDFSVKNKLSEAAQATLGLPAHKVKVFAKKS